MAVTVRVNEDNYVSLKAEADKERRSVIGQLDYILDQYFKRDTVGSHIPEKGLPQKTEAPKPAVDDLFQKKSEVTSGELDCCKNEFKPCKHWVWDSDSGEGYKNTLSGRIMEVE